VTSTVLLTGASGYLGGAVRRRLVERGDEVVALGRRDAEVRVDLQVETVSWALVRRESRVLVHCAGVMANDAAAVVDTVKIAANLLAELPAHVTRLVLVSSAYVYAPSSRGMTEDDAPAPVDAYGFAKVSVEALFEGVAKASGRSLTILRPSAIFGPNDPNRKAVTRFVADARRGVAPTLVGDVTFPRDYVHIDDAARAVVAAIDVEPPVPVRTYNVCTGRSWSPVELARLIGELCPAARIDHPPMAEGPVGYRFDPGRAARELGWTSRIDMRTAIASLLSEGEER